MLGRLSMGMLMGIARASLGFLAVLAACSGSDDEGGGDRSCDSTPPELSVTEVNFSTVAVDEFLPFGALLAPGQLNPAYELRLHPLNADVHAVTAGVVEAVEANPIPQTDFEIRVRARPRSCYLVIYDHVFNAMVSVGASITPGQVLGQIGPWDTLNGRIELQINVDRPNGTSLNSIAVCPASLGTAMFNNAHDMAYAQANGMPPGVCWQREVVP